MAQRLTQQFRVFYGIEGASEGIDPTAPALGVAAKYLLVKNLKTNPTQAWLQRRFFGAAGYRPGRVGELGDPTIEFECELRNRGGTNNLTQIDELLRVCFGGRIPVAQGTADSGNTTCSASTSGSSFTLAGTAGFANGQGIMVENPKASGKYEAAVIDTLVGSVVTLKQPLSFTPDPTGAAIKSMVTFNTADTGHQSLALQVWLDSDNYLSFVGCKATASITSPGAGAIPMIKFSWKANAWSINNSVGNRPAMGPINDTGNPPIGLSSKHKIDATITDLLSFQLDLGASIARKKSQNSTYGTYAQVVADRTPNAKLTYYNIDDTKWSDWKAMTSHAFSLQFGNALNNMVHLCVPKALIKAVGYGDQSGLTSDDIDVEPDITNGGDDIFLAMG